MACEEIAVSPKAGSPLSARVDPWRVGIAEGRAALSNDRRPACNGGSRMSLRFGFAAPIYVAICLASAVPCCADDPKERAALKGHVTDVRSLAFSPDGKILASGAYGEKSTGNQFVGLIKLWDPSTGKETATLTEHADSVLALVFTKDSKGLISGSGDKTVKVWDLSTKKVTRTLKGHTNVVYALALSSDGKTLASGSYDRTVKLWDLTTGKEVRTLKGHTGEVMALAFSPDGSVLASSSMDKTIKLWNVETGKELVTLKGHKDWVISLAFKPDGKTLASGSADQTIKLWDPDKGEEQTTLKMATQQGVHVAYTSDGKTLVSGGPLLARDGLVCLWDTVANKEKAIVKWKDGLIWNLAVSPDDKTLATTFDTTIRLWDMPVERSAPTNDRGCDVRP
jgi:WD40 repeat protein